MTTEKTDASLLRQFMTGSEDAATALYCRYAQRLLALARIQTSTEFATRFDAEDVVQSVFRSFFRRARDGYYDVPEGGELWQLLLALSLNKIRSLAVYHRAQKRDVRFTTSPGITVGQPETVDDDQLAYRVLEEVIDEVIRELPPVQQAIIRDRIQNFGVAEIAQRSQRSKRTVERTLQQFREQLAKALGDE